MQSRACGVLLHISSLPSAYGIGDLGPAARDFARTLALGGIKYWQFLPLTPTSTFIGSSPYSSPSAFAGNPLFISPELMVEDGYLEPADLDGAYVCVPECGPVNFLRSNASRVDYALVEEQRRTILNLAFGRCFAGLANDAGFQSFCASESGWLEDYALFTAIKEAHGGSSWVDWPDGLKRRDAGALAVFSRAGAVEIARHKFVQYMFFSQWNRLKEFCNSQGVRLIGDMPIYVTHDSVDVWANPGLFKLDEAGAPVAVAGVPPDYFSETGQRWGNPVYDWDAMKKDGFAWWKARLGHSLKMVDMLRLDHFRGFCAYWEIRADEETAVNGVWVPAPGRELFSALRESLGELPVIAEDLGIITDDVRELMAEFGLPGMKVLQFAFGGQPGEAPDLPFRHRTDSIVYTGTHDNATTLEWFMTAPEAERGNFADYLGRRFAPGQAHEALEAMIRLALGSVAAIAVLPMQDIIGLGPEGRMNTPSVPDGNFVWRLTDRSGWAAPGSRARPEVFDRLHELCRIYGRVS